MVKYELRVHVRDVISSVFWGILISFKINKEENEYILDWAINNFD